MFEQNPGAYTNFSEFSQLVASLQTIDQNVQSEKNILSLSQ